MTKNFKFAICLAVLVLMASAMSTAQAASGNSAPATVASTAQPAATGDTTVPGFSKRDDRYRLRESDVFDISFELTPEYNQTQIAVQPDGYVTLRGLGDIKVVGQTVPELNETLHMAYSKILHDPIIFVTLRDFQKPYFIADGQVLKPESMNCAAT